MRFMMIVKANQDSEAGVLQTEEQLAAMAKYNEELVKAGVLLAAEGLQASSQGARVRFSGAKRSPGPSAAPSRRARSRFARSLSSRISAQARPSNSTFSSGSRSRRRPRSRSRGALRLALAGSLAVTIAGTHRAIEAVWRIESARLIAGLTRIVRDVGLAEDLAQDTLVVALERWPASGVPDNPGAWLMAAAKHRATDQFRRMQRLQRKHEEIGRGLAARQEMAAREFEAAFAAEG